MMLRKTGQRQVPHCQLSRASMRPQHDAAENMETLPAPVDEVDGFNEAAA